MDQLKRCEIIPESAVKELCLKAKEVLMEEGNVQYVDSPVTVRHTCGSSRVILIRSRYVGIYTGNSST